MQTEAHVANAIRDCAPALSGLLSHTVEIAKEAAVITDCSGTILYVNSAFERMTGYERKEVLGKNPRILNSGKHNPGHFRQMWTTVTRGEVWHNQIINKRKDGTLYQCAAAIHPIRDESGWITHYIGLELDIGREIELEERLFQSQTLQSVGQLAGDVASDFNNLLTAIMGYSDLLLRRMSAKDPGKFFVDEIKKAGDRATTLTRQLLSFSRKQVIQPKVFNLNAVAIDMGRMLRRLIGEDIKIVLPTGASTGLVKADPAQIEQVFLSLAVNACDAMPKGGTLVIETANVEVDGDYASEHDGVRTGPYVLLTITDTGCGMDAATQARIFEPFFTTKEHGAGMGLASVMSIVKQVGGHIHVDSEPTQGTTFKLYFPRVEETTSFKETTKVTVRTFPGTETVLLVEDEFEVRTLVRQLLQINGYHVLEAKDATSAIAEAESFPKHIHMMLADVVLPGMNGRDLFDCIQEQRPDMRVLFMSGHTDAMLSRHVVLNPGMALIRKPFTAHSLARKMREILESGSASQKPATPTTDLEHISSPG